MENNTFDTVIGLNVSLKGNLYNKGSIQVNGTIEGEIKSDENLTIGETAVVKGPIFAKTIDISGEISGTVEASEQLEITPTGKVYGDIKAKTLIIKQGAIFVGSSTMTEASKAKVTIEEKVEIKDAVTPSSDKSGFFGKK